MTPDARPAGGALVSSLADHEADLCSMWHPSARLGLLRDHMSLLDLPRGCACDLAHGATVCPDGAPRGLQGLASQLGHDARPRSQAELGCDGLFDDAGVHLTAPGPCAASTRPAAESGACRRSRR